MRPRLKGRHAERFEEFFRAATGYWPHDYQSRLASVAHLPYLVGNQKRTALAERAPNPDRPNERPPFKRLAITGTCRKRLGTIVCSRD